MTRSTSTTSDFPWEDTLILAFRDMQWNHAFKRIVAFNRKLKAAADVEAQEKIRCETPRRTLPALLAKLDGDAENASGDVITSADTRFYLLEFKSARSKIATESDKFIHHLMSEIRSTNEDHIEFEELCRAGHFFVYPSTTPVDPAKDLTADAVTYGNGRALHLWACPYVDGIRKSPDCEFPAQDLLSGNVGWDFPDMLAYLKILTQLRSKTAKGSKTGSGGHPMKVAIATQNGVFWPYGDLADVLAMTRIFQQTLAMDAAAMQRHATKLVSLEPILADTLLQLALIEKRVAAEKRKATRPRAFDTQEMSKN